MADLGRVKGGANVPPFGVVSQARPNQPQRGSLSVSHTGKEGSGDSR